MSLKNPSRPQHRNAAILLASVYRGDTVESVHYGHFVLVDTAGRTLLHGGDPETAIHLRSCAKPFQIIPLLESGAVEAFGFAEQELAVACASHNGAPRHVAAVEAMLAKAGLHAGLLQCGVHRPLGIDAGAPVADPPYSALHNNCSGKHTAMLAGCKYLGLPLENYFDPAHPYQQKILQKISHYSALPEKDIGIAVDGCSAPEFVLPLKNLAHMYAQLAVGADRFTRRIYEVMCRHPEMVAGEGRFDTALMQALRGKVVAKIGAEGVRCLAIRHPQPMGLVLKVADGAKRAVPPVVLQLLRHLRVFNENEFSALKPYAAPAIRNHRGMLVGRVESMVAVDPG